MCGFSIHSRAQWSLVVVGSLIPFIKLEPCKGMVRGCYWTGPRAGSRTPCIEINLCRHEFPRPPGPLPRVLYAQAAASLVAILFRRRGFSCLPGTGAWLQHVAVGGWGWGRGGGVVCCSAIWPIRSIRSPSTVDKKQNLKDNIGNTGLEY